METKQIIIAVLGIIATLLGGTFIFKGISKKRHTDQSNIKIGGKNNRVTGGDDNSSNS